MTDKKSKFTEIRRDSDSNWKKAKNYTPSFGTIVIYEFDDSTLGLKFGDGATLVNDLPFLVQPNQPKVIENNLVL